MLNTPVGRLRAVALAEGASFLLLLGIAMPLKYLAGMPAAVKLVGWAHGVLFMAFVLALAEVALTRTLPWKRIVAAAVASVVPFGPFVLDGHLRRDERLAPRRA